MRRVGGRGGGLGVTLDVVVVHEVAHHDHRIHLHAAAHAALLHGLHELPGHASHAARGAAASSAAAAAAPGLAPTSLPGIAAAAPATTTGAAACFPIPPAAIQVGAAAATAIAAALAAALATIAAASATDFEQLGRRDLAGLLHHLQDVRGGARLVLEQEGVRVALLAGSARAPDAVDVVLCVVRRVVVDHELHILDVQASLGDVGRYQDLGLAVLERPQGVVAFPLLHVAMQAYDRCAVPGQLLVHVGRRPLCLREDKRSSARLLQLREDCILEELHLLVLAVDLDYVLGDVGVAGRSVRRAHLDVHGIVREPGGHLLHLRGPGGCKQGRLPLRRQILRDLLDLRLEAHVQHPIRLVHDQVQALADLDGAFFEEVIQPTRRRHHAMRAVPKVPLLRSLGGAAVGASRDDLRRLAKSLRLLSDLLAQLTRRRKN
mmetsp:Transcript_100526/g.255769  ORF Transcript_100526/g.255769 Transcript_100526/m.255769 type:complete len:434 (-) Transcript_100526:391-1692(-)